MSGQCQPDIAPPTAVQEALALLKWLREPDYAENFSLEDLSEWLNRRPVAQMCRVVDALSGGEAVSPAKSPYGKHRVQHEGVTLECDYFVPGLTLHELTMIFERATKSEGVSEYSGNPANWPTVRGVTAVAEAVRDAFALPSEAIGREWQDIETAPKNHDDFLAWGDQHGMRKAYWALWFDNITQAEREGWRDTHSLERLPELTHWMQLPDGPSVSRPTSGGAA